MPKPKVAKKRATVAKHAIMCDGVKLGGAAATILNMAAALQAGKKSVSRKVLISMCGTLGKSTVANAFTKLKNMGLLIVEPNKITVTDLGMESADIDAANLVIPTTNEELRASIKEKFKLKGKEIELMDLLSDSAVHDKKEVKETLGIKGTSTFANLLTKLKKFEIIQFDRNTIQLTRKMYLDDQDEEDY